jgi:hypothetical protein
VRVPTTWILIIQTTGEAEVAGNVVRARPGRILNLLPEEAPAREGESAGWLRQ